MTKNKKLTIVLVVVLAALIGAFAAVYLLTRPETSDAQKTVTIVVTHKDGAVKSFEAKTEAEYLRQVLDELKLAQGEESEYGLFIKTVDGYTVDDANQEWWSLTKGGEMVMTGAEATPVYDGDTFELSLMVGYDLY